MIIDIIIITLVIITISYFYVSSTLQKEDLFFKTIEFTEKLFDDPNSIFITIITLFLFYVLMFVIGISMTSEFKPFTIRIIEDFLWIILILCVINKGIKFLFDINLADITMKQIYNIWNSFHSKEKKSKIEDKKIDVNNDEVFNVANNLYTYQDAQAICQSFDSRLATYDEVEHSYKKGGEWCNYGWSDSQMILFPTQKTTWNQLQKTSTSKNSCGRPGVNGGYLNDASQKFGVNCFGKKPNEKKKEENQMLSKSGLKTKEDDIFDVKVNYWRDNADKMLTVNSFNSNNWNENTSFST